MNEMNVEDYDYILPERLIAQTPLLERTQSRLLTLDKSNGKTAHLQFEQLYDLLNPGDLLVLFGLKRDTGAKAEVLLLKALGEDCWEVLIRPGKRLKRGAEIVFGDQLSAVIEEEGDMGIRKIRFSYHGIFNEILDKLGQMPLPPYIK
jgi:S-adenosylmethionine:tRNA ribosyltransferase-isomerase